MGWRPFCAASLTWRSTKVQWYRQLPGAVGSDDRGKGRGTTSDHGTASRTAVAPALRARVKASAAFGPVNCIGSKIAAARPPGAGEPVSVARGVAPAVKAAAPRQT